MRITPEPWGTMRRPASRAQRNMPPRLIPITRFHWS